MGKKVFEIAKDLGVDHRDVMKRCDELRIGVKTYMSELSDADAAAVKSSFDAERRGQEEKAGAPGVLRRKRPEPGPAPVAPKGPAPLKPPVAVAPAARPGVVARPSAPRPESGSGAPPSVRPSSEGAVTGPSRPAEPAVAQTQPVSVETAPRKPESEVDAPVERARIIAPPPAAPPPVEGDGDGQARIISRPTPAPTTAPTAPAEAVPAEMRRPPAAATASPPGGQPAPPAQPPRPIPPGTPGGAKVLGTVPLDLLRSRTARPPARRPGPGGPGGPGGPDRRPAGPPGPGGPPGARRPPGGRPMPVDINQVVPLTPVDRGDGTRRRRPGGEVAPAPDTREQDKARAAKPVAGKKRQVVSREDIYAGAARTGRGRKRKVPTKKTHKTPLTTPAAHKRIVRIDGTISVGELGKELGVKAAELIQKLISMGMMVGINAQIDEDTATLLANEYGYEVEDVGFDEDEFLDTPDEDETDPDAILRAPVITVMGHVDHGKTSLLDRIRKANVAAGEAGGITQHIGAYKVTTAQGDVVFLDTPGHAAFTAMRARGAQVTDLVVLVVAADDGVMPQTIEAISHARAAEVPVIVAINKIDKPGADIERIKQELTKYNLVAEEWGGDTMMVPVSALKGTGVQELLEALALQAEVLELKANPKKPAFGRVVEARMDKGRGPVATVLVQEGTLKVGDFMVSGAQCGRLRAMVDDKGNRLKEAGPSTPVEVLGLDGIPGAGEAFHIVASEKDARRVVEARFDKAREKDLAAASASAAAAMGGDVFARLNQANKETLRVILKTDVQGSLEALRSILEQLSTDEVSLRIIHSGVGGITEGDVTLAQASEAVCIGFNVTPDSNAKRLADQTGVKIRKFEVVYEVADEVKLMMGGLLAPEIVETQLGRAEVRAAFQVARMGAVAGCFVQEGKIQRNVRGRVFREGKLFHEGKIVGLKRFKEDVREVATGFECGIAVDNYNDIQTGDVIEAVEIKEVARKLA